MRMISSKHWQSYFAHLAQKHMGKVVSFEVGEDLVANDPPANEVPLLGIEYDKHGRSYLHGKRGGNTNVHRRRAGSGLGDPG